MKNELVHAITLSLLIVLGLISAYNFGKIRAENKYEKGYENTLIESNMMYKRVDSLAEIVTEHRKHCNSL